MRKFNVLTLIVVSVALPSLGQDINYSNLDNQKKPHQYWERVLNDPFSKMMADFESGKRELDNSNSKAFLTSLLDHLDIPASSQLLVFSRTSLQTRFISGSNPRAVYFNEDVYVGYIPGGKIEIISLDPDVGGVFYIFKQPKDGPLEIERSNRCLDCHLTPATRRVPGISIRSVIPGSNWGALVSHRRNQIGHQIPLSERFGGWHVTGDSELFDHKGNLIGEKVGGKVVTEVIEPGTQFDWSSYPVATSDVLPHLILEHQAGFMNLALEATFRERTYRYIGKGNLKPEEVDVLHGLAEELVRYVLFADEAKFPEGGIQGDPQYREDFLADRRETSSGISLKDFDLETRLFKHRCSYLIYSDVFQGTPDVFKQHFFQVLGEALDPEKSDSDFAFLPAPEKQVIRGILRETLDGLPEGW